MNVKVHACVNILPMHTQNCLGSPKMIIASSSTVVRFLNILFTFCPFLNQMNVLL